jgi:hypothetical protein
MTKKMMVVMAVLMVMAGAAHAGDYPEVGDLFKFAKGGAIHKVVKVKNIMGDVMDAKVCVKPIGAKGACKWVKAGAGNWADPKNGF